MEKSDGRRGRYTTKVEFDQEELLREGVEETEIENKRWTCRFVR